ncbi:MBL fold metallo-hydrolase [Candidatus Woesearchaeota archaeon]|nr:MBL fold metallo-hydrolase [Candidatus Woesearchaeota archaeon]HIH38350.1 hypothetical protein [Candidatus Woesearchaeota archaeon]HIH49357.1 hypothetical protein [Candidatus Woesearchaeota archaeon]HIJ03513.1 hypothetical protein [Candidatus Woesearchaeota archaeon]
MEPKIIFLGTGGDAIVVGKHFRSAGGIILQVQDFQFHIDPGPGALSMAKNFEVSLRNNTAVLVSHNHLNHCNDINAVISAMTYSGLDKLGVLIGNTTLFDGAEGVQSMLIPPFNQFPERNILLTPGKKVGIEDIEITALKAEHTDPNTIGFYFRTPTFTLAYSSDTKFKKEIAEGYTGVDVLVLNVPYPSGEKADQLGTRDVIKIIEISRPKLAIITHFGIKMLKADPLNEARVIQRETNVQTIAAKDGMQINPITFASRIRQMTLKQFAE